MRIEWLEYYSDAARLGSIKASADMHSISPQGLSKCIRSLEKELGVQLFERDANSVHLTPGGLHLLDQVRATVDAAQELKRQAHDIASGAEGTPLTVMCSSFVFLSGMLEPLREGMALIGRSATYVQTPTDDMFEALRMRTSPLREDRALCGVPILFSPSGEANREALSKAGLNGYDYIALLRYADGALVSAGHPLAGRASVTRADLTGHPIVSSSVEQLVPLTRYLGAKHITGAIADMATRLRVIQDDESIIFMPPFFDIVDDTRYRLLPIEDPYEVEVGFIYERDSIDFDSLQPLFGLLVSGFAAHEAAGKCTIAFRS